MRLLLIAYEFPPSPSPQSLRWAYLCRELHRLGHEVHVLTIDLGGSTPGLPELPDGVTVHRTYAGHVRGLVARRRRHRERGRNAESAVATARPPARASRSGWKQKLSSLLQRLAEFVWFPDLRGEWLPIGRARLDALLEHVRPDVVVSSHEPATTLELGLRARAAGFRWIADLADPVLAPYTPSRWRARAQRLEAEVCRRAEHVLVTTPSARDVLRERHGHTAPISVLTQGFEDVGELADGTPVEFDTRRLELLYTGSFYAFRSADALLQAVIDTPGVRLNIATVHAPDALLEAIDRHPDRIRLLGFLPHRTAIATQREADVLVNLANRDAMQVPGKCYEYLGAGRPILHLGDAPGDAVAALVRGKQRGWVAASDADRIATCLRELVVRKNAGTLAAELSLGIDEVAEFGWSRLAARLDVLLRSQNA